MATNDRAAMLSQPVSMDSGFRRNDNSRGWMISVFVTVLETSLRLCVFAVFF
jgi:hypothetical protein